MPKTSLTKILDGMIADHTPGSPGEIAINMMIIAFGDLSARAKAGERITIDDVDTEAYFDLLRDRREAFERKQRARERVASKAFNTAMKHQRFSPHHDFWMHRWNETKITY